MHGEVTRRAAAEVSVIHACACEGASEGGSELSLTCAFTHLDALLHWHASVKRLQSVMLAWREQVQTYSSWEDGVSSDALPGRHAHGRHGHDACGKTRLG